MEPNSDEEAFREFMLETEPALRRSLIQRTEQTADVTPRLRLWHTDGNIGTACGEWPIPRDTCTEWDKVELGVASSTR